MKESFFKNVIKYSIPNIVSFILGIVSVVVLTRIFSTETYGIINIFNNTSALFLSIAYLGLDSAFIRFYNDLPRNINSKQLGFF